MFRVLAILLVVVPSVALAAVDFGGPLVPNCGLDVSGFMCQACHLAALTHNILVFLIALAVGASAIMFAYAGFLYVTAAANHGNIDSAKRIFGQVFIGLVLVLCAWLVVDLALRVFTGQSLQVLTKFQCVRAIAINGSFAFPESSIDAVIPPQTQQAIPGQKLTHEEALALLRQCGYTVTSTKGPSQVYASCQTDGCTSVQGLRTDSVAAACAAAKACGKPCEGKLVITGGTECFAHGTKSSITHCNGYKVDIGDTPAFRIFISDPNNGFFTKVPPGQPTRSGFPEWKDKCGNSIIDEGDHFDYQVTKPCSA